LSDIHSNLEALTSVFNDIEKQKIDAVHCLGDVIGYGIDPGACLELVNKKCEIKLMGNHEYAAMGLISTEHYNQAAQHATEWTKNQITDYELSIIAEFEMEHSLKNIFLVHASPNEPEQWHYILTPEAASEVFPHFKENICFIGHTHLPQIFIEQDENTLPRCQTGHDFLPDKENRYIINVGSVGQPRDNDPKACYLIFDTEKYEIVYRRVEYDISLTQNKMTREKMPEMLISRLSEGR
ncbi:MAG: metallophosphoesterase family protein, partial [Candidatus Zixiibacteriota bacterium]